MDHYQISGKSDRRRVFVVCLSEHLKPFTILKLRAHEQKMGDFREWDRTQSGEIHPIDHSQFRNERSSDKPDRQLAPIRDNPTFYRNSPASQWNDQLGPAPKTITKEMVSPPTRVNSNLRTSQRPDRDGYYGIRQPNSYPNNARITNVQRVVVNGRIARDYSAGNRTQPGNPGGRLKYEGAFDARPQMQAAGGMILSRSERIVYLANGDRIQLPWDALWSGLARVSIEESVGREVYYDVTIRTRGGEPLDSRIISFARGYGPEAALEIGVAALEPPVWVHGMLTATITLMRATPIPDGEAVEWHNVPSAFGGRSTVRIIREP